MDLPAIQWEEEMENQLKKNSNSVDWIKRRLFAFYQPTMDAVKQRELNIQMSFPLKLDAEEFNYQKQCQKLNSDVCILGKQEEQLDAAIRSAKGECVTLLNGKEYLEKELEESREDACVMKLGTENLSMQLNLLNTCVKEFVSKP